MFGMRRLYLMLYCMSKGAPFPVVNYFSRQHLSQQERPHEAGGDCSVCEWRERVREKRVQCVCVCTSCLASMHMPDNALHNVIHLHVHVSLTYYELMY